MSVTSYPVLAQSAVASHSGFGRRIGQAALVAAAVAAITASAHMRIPMWPVPATMQTFAVMMIGAAYGPSLAAVSVLAYLALGAAGVAVFTGAAGTAGGLAYMVGPTGGYLAGFLLATLAVGALAQRGWDRSVSGMAVALLIGNVALYACGLGWLAWLFAGSKGLGWVLQMGLFNFLPGDLLKLALGALLMPALRRVASR